MYRFVLSDRNKEIAVGDIVKAPIPPKSGAKTMKFNALKTSPKQDKGEDVQVTTHDEVITHYVGIVRHLGTTKIVNKGIEEDVVTYLGLELV